MNRRQILVGTGVSLTLAAVAPLSLIARPAAAQDSDVTANDRILGDPNAPVTIIEYASLTCPHCAQFHANTLPDIKKNWIDTGKARLVYRDYPLDGVALQAGALARCVDEDRYFGFLDVLFRSQTQWARSSDPVGALGQIARLSGMDADAIDACFANTEVMNGILEGQQTAQQKYDISATPSFIVNGEKITGGRSAEEFEKILNDAAS